MFTKNFKSWLNIIPIATGDTIDGQPQLYTDYNGNKKIPIMSYANMRSTDRWLGLSTDIKTSVSSMASAGVYLGAGNTEPTEDDYTLSGALVVTGFNWTKSQKQIYNADGSFTLQTIYTITNVGAETITIGEIASVILADCQAVGSINSTTCYIMIDRTVLSETLILAPQEVGQITYERTLKF